MTNAIVYTLGFCVAALAVTLYIKMERSRHTQEHLDRVEEENRAFQEQTKVIIQTDLEVKKLQEELDRRTKSLFILHKISRLLLTTLDEEEVVNKLQPPFFRDFGFDKFILIIIDEEIPKVKYSINVSEEALNAVNEFMDNNPSVHSTVFENEFAFSWQEGGKGIWHEFLLKNIKSSHFLNIPLRSSRSTLGTCIFTKKDVFSGFDEVDIEIARLLVFQVAQAIDTSRLFEEKFKQTRELDLTVREQTKQLRDANEELKNINRLKSQFVSSVSHELRTPLTSIKGFAALLSAGKFGQLPEEACERIKRINAHTDILVEMIDKLLDIARIESGREDFMIRPESLNELIKDAKEMIAPQAHEKEIDVAVNIPEEKIQVMCDSQKIHCVFVNLLSNAVKFTLEKGNITIKAEDLGEKIKISISDTGIGIPEKDLDKIFEEFHRSDNASNMGIKGTGLGLSLVKKILLAHNENIEVASKERQGTTFTFTLRRA